MLRFCKPPLFKVTRACTLYSDLQLSNVSFIHCIVSRHGRCVWARPAMMNTQEATAEWMMNLTTARSIFTSTGGEYCRSGLFVYQYMYRMQAVTYYTLKSLRCNSTHCLCVYIAGLCDLCSPHLQLERAAGYLLCHLPTFKLVHYTLQWQALTLEHFIHKCLNQTWIWYSKVSTRH